MYDNEWLKLSRFYFMEYKNKVKDCLHPQSPYYFILDAPNEDDIKEQWSASGDRGLQIANQINLNERVSLGEFAKNDTRFSILNVSRVPLSLTSELDSKYMSLVQTLNAEVKEGYSQFSQHDDDNLNKFEQAVLYDFRQRLLNALKGNEGATLVVCTDFAKAYIEKMKDELQAYQIIDVTDFEM